jgi:alkylated DNA repair dioxygenase AlkB
VTPATTTPSRTLTLDGGGTLRLFEAWLDAPEADAALDEILQSTPWAQQHIVLFGRRIAQPRLSTWMGDPDATYTYSGLTQRPAPWTLPVAALRARVEATTGRPFNGVLLNLYRDGNDSMGLHADDERELGEDPAIASVSLGAERTFLLKPRKRRGVAPVRVALPHGSLLVMDGAVQRAWVHGLPKEPSVRAPRVNLTFRRIECTAT